jgi:magnesium transporter
MATLDTRAFKDGKLVDHGFEIGRIPELLADRDKIVWVGLQRPAAEQIVHLASEFGIHELAAEDVLEPFQRPKLDVYDQHYLFVSHAVRVIDSDPPRLDHAEIDLLVGDRWIVAVDSGGWFPFEALETRWEHTPRLTKLGVGYFAYTIIDLVVDGYFDALDALEEYYDSMADRIFDEKPLEPEKQRDWFEVRRSLTAVRRFAMPTREAVAALLRHEHALISPDLYPYFQDVYDHVLRISDSLESLRDLVTSLVETNLSLRDFRQNQVVKKVGSWAAIIAVPTLVTGYYGMNVPYPGSGSTSGVVTSAGLMLVGVAILYWIFRMRDWL